MHALRYVLLAEEAASRHIVPAGGTRGVALERRRPHTVRRRVSLEDLILVDQTSGAFGKDTCGPILTGLRTLPRLFRSVWGSKIE